jgi:hypothetical protein
MCTVLLPPGDNPIAVNKYININNIESIHREVPGAVSRNLSVRRWTKYLHIDGEELRKNAEKIECEARDVILRPGLDARNIESKLNHTTERNLLPDATLCIYVLRKVKTP